MPDLMSEPLSEDRTRAAFASLRSSELANVRPPGTVAAHRTVRRRTTTRAVTVAGCLVLAIGGVFVAAPHVGSNNPAARPDADEAATWGRVAAQALAEEVKGPKVVATSSGPLLSNVRDTDEAADFKNYRLKVVCAGAGTMHVEMRTSAGVAVSDVPCGSSAADAFGQSGDLELGYPPAAPGITITLTPDEGAMGKAGFAYVLTSF